MQAETAAAAQALQTIEEAVDQLKQRVKDSDRAMFNGVLQTKRIMTEDTQFISNHAQRIAEWLDELTVQSPADLAVV